MIWISPVVFTGNLNQDLETIKNNQLLCANLPKFNDRNDPIERRYFVPKCTVKNGMKNALNDFNPSRHNKTNL